jgi:hypothetical protein
MAKLITPAEIDPYIGINECAVETWGLDGWDGYAESLHLRALNSKTEMVEVIDAEGEFVCFCTREMAEYIKQRLNNTGP